jgi:hypothetical protein
MEEWFEEVPAPGVDPNLGGVFEWRIHRGTEMLVYVGGFRSLAKVGEYYRKSLQNLQNGKRSRHPEGEYRLIYHELVAAMTEGRAVSLVLTENVTDRKVRADRELAIHAAREAEGATVLNQNLAARLDAQRRRQEARSRYAPPPAFRGRSPQG